MFTAKVAPELRGEWGVVAAVDASCAAAVGAVCTVDDSVEVEAGVEVDLHGRSWITESIKFVMALFCSETQAPCSNADAMQFLAASSFLKI